MESNFYTHSFNTKRAGMLAKCTALLLSLVCSLCITFTAKADGVAFNYGGRAGQITATGFTNMTYFSDPITQSIFVYLQAGESLFYEMRESSRGAASSRLYCNIYSPYGKVGSEIVLSPTDTTNATEGYIAVTAETAGIWTITMRTVGSNFWRYNIDARTDGTDSATRIGGRVYAELVHLYQGDTAHIPFYVSTLSGHKYDVILWGYNGRGSRLSSDQFGNASSANCNQSLYKSMRINDSAVRNLNARTCGAYNKLFFSPMDSVLPAEAPKWNISTNATMTEWLSPAPIDPVVTELTFTPAGSNPMSGNFTFKVDNYAGGASLLLDLDNDGVYDGPNDRSIPFGVASDETITVPFDGLAANSTTLPNSSIIKAKVLIDRTGEVHFTMIDVEDIDGITIVRTTGDPTNNDIVYWNDIDLPAKNTTTPIKDGTAGYASNTASGVHGWANHTNAWGNEALIDNWTYIQSNSTQEITVEGCDANAGTISR